MATRFMGVMETFIENGKPMIDYEKEKKNWDEWAYNSVMELYVMEPNEIGLSNLQAFYWRFSF